MALISRPLATDGLTVIPAQTLARGGRLSGQLDLRTKLGGYAFIRIGRQGANALTNGVSVLLRRVPNGGAAGWWHPVGFELPGSYAAASGTTVSADSASGGLALNVASVSGFAPGDIVSIEAADHSRLEFHRLAATAVGVLTLDAPLQYSHTTAQADTVRNKADVFPPMYLEGWSMWDVTLDYADDTAGDAVTVQVLAQALEGTSIVG